MKFNIRDLLWLMLVAAILFGWWVHRAVYLEQEREVIKLRNRVKQLEALTPTILVRPVPSPGTRFPSGIQFDFKHSPKDKFDPFPQEIQIVD
jgi:hypothetical protein